MYKLKIYLCKIMDEENHMVYNELMPSFNYVYSMDNSQRDDIQERLDCRDALLYHKLLGPIQ